MHEINYINTYTKSYTYTRVGLVDRLVTSATTRVFCPNARRALKRS